MDFLAAAGAEVPNALGELVGHPQYVPWESWEVWGLFFVDMFWHFVVVYCVFGVSSFQGFRGWGVVVGFWRLGF